MILASRVDVVTNLPAGNGVIGIRRSYEWQGQGKISE